MKNLRLLIAGISAAVLVTGCGVTQDGFSSASMQKRKYTKGFYISKRSHLKAKEESTDASIVKEDATSENEKLAVLAKRNVTGAEASKQEVKVQHQQGLSQNSELIVEKAASKKVQKSNGTVSSNQQSQKQLKKADKNEVKNVLRKQKQNSHSSGDDLLILCIILAILIPPLGVGVWTNIDWTKVLICLLLTLLFFLPGMIYALLVVLDKI